MIYGSVCSGIEAASVAWHPLGWTPAFFAEIEKFPSRVLAHHFGSNMPGAADGPRYKALGNSMAINVMRAVGQRIDMVEKLIQAGKIKPETFQEQAE